jgi:hypothetical protein
MLGLTADEDSDNHSSFSEDYEDEDEQIIEQAKDRRAFSDQKMSRDDSHVGTFSKSLDSYLCHFMSSMYIHI